MTIMIILISARPIIHFIFQQELQNHKVGNEY